MSLVKDKKAQRRVLAFAGALLLLALGFRFLIARDDPLESIVGMLRDFGYRVYDSDLYIAGDYRDTSIGALLAGVDLQAAREASLAAGFPSDTERVGDVVLILAATAENQVITLYALDGEMELCFIQYRDSDRVGVLGE